MCVWTKNTFIKKCTSVGLLHVGNHLQIHCLTGNRTLSHLTAMIQHYVVVLLLTSLSSGVMVAMVSVSIVSFLPLLFPPCSLTIFCTKSLQFLLSFAVVLHSSFSHSPLHRSLCLPPLLFPSTFWASAFCVSFTSPILSTWPGHFNLLHQWCSWANLQVTESE